MNFLGANCNRPYPISMTDLKKRILIVDDDEDIRNLMVLYLLDLGVESVCVDCAIKGLKGSSSL